MREVDRKLVRGGGRRGDARERRGRDGERGRLGGRRRGRRGRRVRGRRRVLVVGRGAGGGVAGGLRGLVLGRRRERRPRQLVEHVRGEEVPPRAAVVELARAVGRRVAAGHRGPQRRAGGGRELRRALGAAGAEDARHGRRVLGP